jgi:CheY-like chemotaxis protein
LSRILVIEDQSQVRSVILTVLRAKGYDVVGANNGVSGLKMFDESHFDLAIVDLYMPGVDGVKVIKELRSRRPDLPILAISGVLLGDSNHTALDFFPSAAGLSDITCLKKPFKASQLLVAVEKAGNFSSLGAMARN